MTDIPFAIQNLMSLQRLDLTNAPTDCTCDLVWFKKWLDYFDMSGLTIYGRCVTINQEVSAYVHTRLPTCPDMKLQFG
ncbi:hypothetical protein DPMN_141095 [Dreissena polymorpha]|uniref:LRRCT domain-containing protein n=1 Tax=Dreissena polymorpha TaxID=45954 RepID=A0A9D4JKZ0_DREPO|nr:hypothetical protein DPMN_141095 [Dreissena polymorpha]